MSVHKPTTNRVVARGNVMHIYRNADMESSSLFSWVKSMTFAEKGMNLELFNRRAGLGERDDAFFT